MSHKMTTVIFIFTSKVTHCFITGRKERGYKDELEQVEQVAQGCLRALEMNYTWVMHTLNDTSRPQVINTGIGEFEYYYKTGISYSTLIFFVNFLGDNM